MAKSLFRLFPIITIFFGCLFDGDDGPKVPPLNEDVLNGCWTEINPAPMKCIEYCFLDSSMFYDIIRSEEGTGIQGVGEYFGTYSVTFPNNMDIIYSFRRDFVRETNGAYHSLTFVIVGDTLINTTGGGYTLPARILRQTASLIGTTSRIPSSNSAYTIKDTRAPYPFS